MNAGANLQEQTSNKDASDVEYTLENGSPYPHPYQYQRIGSDGE